MPLFRRRGARGSDPGRSDGPHMRVDLSTVEHHLAEFAQTRRGVEGYVEPSTNVSATTIVLIALDGEWTRRAVGTPKDAFSLARKLGIPVYDVNQTGYPSRMREWSARKKAEAKAAERRERGTGR